MNPVLVLNERSENKPTYKIAQTDCKPLDRHCVLIAAVDNDIRAALTQLLEVANVEAVWVRSVKDVKALTAKRKITACLCGFWLQDGTYREVVRHLRRERMDIPAIIVSAATCPHEFREYLAAIDLGSLDILSYPYEQSDFDRIMEFAISSRTESARQSSVDTVPQMEVRGAA